jgi:hypothetical protein
MISIRHIFWFACQPRFPQLTAGRPGTCSRSEGGPDRGEIWGEIRGIEIPNYLATALTPARPHAASLDIFTSRRS